VTMTTCSECKAEISSSSAACPKCGANRKPPLLLWAGLSLLILGLAGFAMKNPGNGPHPAIIAVFLGIALLVVRAMRGRSG